MGSTNELWSELMTEDEMSFFEELGNRIAAWRQEQDMTQAQLGDALGVTQQVVASYEIGRRRVPASLISTLAETLGVSVVDLLGADEREKQKRGPKSKLERQLEQVKRLPRGEQQYVSKFLDQVLSRTSNQ